MPEPISFHGVLAEAGGGGALVELPSAAIAALGDAKRVRVRGTLNGVGFASNTMPMGGGRLCLGVHKATRLAAGAAFGDEVTVTMRVDDAPRVVELPAELHEALAADPEARAQCSMGWRSRTAVSTRPGSPKPNGPRLGPGAWPRRWSGCAADGRSPQRCAGWQRGHQ
jgi:hypothetical protein